MKWFRRRPRGGRIGRYRPETGVIPVQLSPGQQVTDPEEAAALGLTAAWRKAAEREPRCDFDCYLCQGPNHPEPLARNGG